MGHTHILTHTHTPSAPPAILTLRQEEAWETHRSPWQQLPAVTQQFWFRCAHPSSPLSAQGPGVLPTAPCKPAHPTGARAPAGSPPAPSLLQSPDRGGSQVLQLLWTDRGRCAAPGSPRAGLLLHTGASPPFLPVGPDSHPPPPRTGGAGAQRDTSCKEPTLWKRL